MKNFKEITERAERNSQISRQMVDDFLIYYEASKDRLDKTFEQKLKRYRHVTTAMPKEWKNILKSQFIAFDKPDIVFYAREQNPDLETDEDIATHIENNPLPYSMLWSGGMTPVIAHDNHLIRYVAARYFDEAFTSEIFEKRFSIEYSDNVYRFSLINWNQFPHYAIAYYDESEELLHLTAMTMEGFDKLVEVVNASGYDLPPDPHDEVSPGMLYTASNILKQDITINPFESLFNPDDVEGSDDDDEQLDAINRYLELLMETINSDKKPDIKKLADRAGIDHDTAADITDQVLGRLPW